MVGKDDTEKPDYTIVPLEILKAVQRIREMGTEKYGSPDNWKTVEDGAMRFWKAALRHTVEAWGDPSAVDPESGCRHIDHIACNLAFIMWFLDPKEEQKPKTKPTPVVKKTVEDVPAETTPVKEEKKQKSTNTKTGTKPKRHRSKPEEIDTGMIIALYQAGRSAAWIADDMRIGVSTVYRVLNRQGKYNDDDERLTARVEEITDGGA